jgi:hypothetical protein
VPTRLSTHLRYLFIPVYPCYLLICLLATSYLRRYLLLIYVLIRGSLFVAPDVRIYILYLRSLVSIPIRLSTRCLTFLRRSKGLWLCTTQCPKSEVLVPLSCTHCKSSKPCKPRDSANPSHTFLRSTCASATLLARVIFKSWSFIKSCIYQPFRRSTSVYLFHTPGQHSD